jgi:hypothetical protein
MTIHESRTHAVRLIVCIAGLMTAASGITAETTGKQGKGSVVAIEGDHSRGYKLLRNGREFVIRGAGGDQRLDVLAACGGNCLRTWGVDAVAARQGEGQETLIDIAHKQGIAVTQGIWLGHERHGFDYGDAGQLDRQRRDVEEAVKRFKDHPALLTWGLGNEMEGPTGVGANPAIWKEINLLAKRVKAIDPHHPVMTVVANVNPEKVRAIQQYAPDIDILGVNAYIGAAGVGKRLHEFGWTKPYCITEFGLPGPWEVENTDWKAPIEPSSRTKAGQTYVAQNTIMEDSKQCLGSYVFLWGHKQEATGSWFSMFLPGGEKTPRVDALAKAWSGNWPANRAPILKAAEVPCDNRRVKPGQKVSVRVIYEDPEGDVLTYDWEVLPESTERRVGGDEEKRPDAVAGAVRSTDTSGEAVLLVPKKQGPYRLFVTVKDGKGSAAVDNWPFFVSP